MGHSGLFGTIVKTPVATNTRKPVWNFEKQVQDRRGEREPGESRVIGRSNYRDRATEVKFPYRTYYFFFPFSPCPPQVKAPATVARSEDRHRSIPVVVEMWDKKKGGNDVFLSL